MRRRGLRPRLRRDVVGYLLPSYVWPIVGAARSMNSPMPGMV